MMLAFYLGFFSNSLYIMSVDSVDSVGDLGNTDNQISHIKTKKKQVSPAKRWCFTLNNYTEEEVSAIVLQFKEYCDIAFFSYEVGDSGTPHLQGYVEFIVQRRPRAVIDCTNRIHWGDEKGRACRGNREQNLRYVTKDSALVFSWGLPKPLKLIGYDDMYVYQRGVLELVLEEPNDRSVIWVYGEKCIGKTQMLRYLCAKHNAYILPVSEKHALAQVYIIEEKFSGQKDPIYCINLTADQSRFQKHMLFSIIEAVKDGVFSANFGTDANGMCLFNPRHMIVFANEKPDFTKTEIDLNRFITYKVDCEKWEKMPNLENYCNGSSDSEGEDS